METATPHSNYLTDGYGLKSWLLTKDHKRIGLLYLISVSAFFVLGAVFAALIRLELLTPAGDLVESDTYNKIFTMHGVIMVFFFLIPPIPAVLGQLPGADHDRREGPGVPEDQPAELVHATPSAASSRCGRW